jgi:hypothetical protein
MRARILAAIVGSVFLISSSHVLAADPKKEQKASPIPWSKVADADRKVLTPLEKDWNQLPAVQQRRLITSAKQYPKLAPIQQERFQERIKEWATLTPEQRQAAREKYKNLSTLPPAKQHELREKWGEKKAPSTAESQPPAGVAQTK